MWNDIWFWRALVLVAIIHQLISGVRPSAPPEVIVCVAAIDPAGEGRTVKALCNVGSVFSCGFDPIKCEVSSHE